MLEPGLTYQLLRNLTSPVVAVTSTRGGKKNGMILDSAVRASIVPPIPRLSVYIHKFNYSHDMVYETGRFCVHLLHTRQFDVIRRLGFVSGRDQDKLAGVPHHTGTLGVPVLDECYAHFECRVANVMDTGSSTCFLGDVVEVGYGKGGGLIPKGGGPPRERSGPRELDLFPRRRRGGGGWKGGGARSQRRADDRDLLSREHAGRVAAGIRSEAQRGAGVRRAEIGRAAGRG